MLTKLVIKLFGLTDISDKLIEAKQHQKQIDEKYWKEKLFDLEEKLKRVHALEVQEYKAQLEMKAEQLKEYKKKEKELDRKEYHLKIQARENAHMAFKISSKVEDFGNAVIKIVGEMKGVKKEVEDYKELIENRK